MSPVTPDLPSVIACDVCNRMLDVHGGDVEDLQMALHDAVQEAVIAALQPQIDDARRRSRALVVMSNDQGLASVEILTAEIVEDVASYRVVDGALIAEGSGRDSPRAIFARGSWQTALRPGPQSWARYLAEKPTGSAHA